jgi:Transglutaminase-like superfamily/FG-GAP-like repeat
MNLKRAVVLIVVLMLVFVSFPTLSFSSDENWYETSITVTVPPGGEVEVQFVDGKLVASNEVDDMYNILSKTPDWLKADLAGNLQRLSRSAERLDEGAFVQVCTLLPENMEVMVVSGHGEKPTVTKISNMEPIDVIPANIDAFSRLSFADIDSDDNSDLIVCPKNGGWYWLSGPTFAIPHSGEGVKKEWVRKPLFPLTNPELPSIVEPVILEKGLSYLDDDGSVTMLDGSEFLFDHPDTFGSISSAGLIFVDASNDIRYFRMIDGKPLGFSSESISLLPNFEGEVHLSLGEEKLYAGTLDGRVIICKPDYQGNFVIIREALGLPFGKKISPQIADLNNDNKDDFIWSDSNGIFASYGPEWITSEKLDLWTETIVAVGDLTADGKPDILTVENGELVIHKAPGFEELDAKLELLEFGKHLYPAIGDANGDSKNDIVVGCEDGSLRVFLAPDWKESDILSSIDAGDFSYPCLGDFDGDGRDDLVISNVLGETYSYKAMPDGWQEYQSWSFIPGYPYYSVKDYYTKYYRESPLLYWSDDSETVSKYVSLLKTCPPNHFDEVAFCIAHTSANVLRTMARMNQANILTRNAAMIYKVDPELDFVELKEYDDFTTCVYKIDDGEIELPRDDYYWFVVHPRTLYELPVAVDASWWDKTFEEYGISQEDWWRHRVSGETFYDGENRVFWREGLFEDVSYGETIISATSKATTLRDAIGKLYGLVGCGKDKHNIFGYLTGDLYPWHIFRKHYGSCGEQSQLFSSCARTVLIPNYIVTNSGEDHQWNEVWLPQGWTHADGSVDDARMYEHGWKKPVSTVWGWRGDDMFFPTTKTVHNKEYEDRDYISDSGYTDTASVEFTILDIKGNSVEGAMILVRSGWRGRNGISIWGYSNAEGKASFDLGFEAYYIIDCISPYGSTGLSRFVVEEGRDYSVTLHVPGVAPISSVRLSSPDNVSGEVEIDVDSVEEHLRPPNRRTSFGYRIGSYLADNYGYRGLKDYPHPVIATQTKLSLGGYNYAVETGSEFGISKKGSFKISNDTNLSWKKITLTARVEFENFNIDIGLPDESIKVKSAEALKLEFELKSTSPIVSLEWSWDEKEWFELNADHVVETGTGGPPNPGIRTLYVRAGALYQDGVRTKTESVEIEILPTNEFVNQPVFQDPRNPLESVSWKIGPFTIPEELDYFLITTSSMTASLDLDIFLYQDKNGNGDISEKGERIATSTNPSCDEKILLKDPETGPYYLLCQGCTCPDKNSKFNLKFSSVPSW